MKISGIQIKEVKQHVELDVDPVEILDQLVHLLIPENTDTRTGDRYMEVPDGYYGTKNKVIGKASDRVMKIIDCGNHLRQLLEDRLESSGVEK